MKSQKFRRKSTGNAQITDFCARILVGIAPKLCPSNDRRSKSRQKSFNQSINQSITNQKMWESCTCIMQPKLIKRWNLTAWNHRYWFESTNSFKPHFFHHISNISLFSKHKLTLILQFQNVLILVCRGVVGHKVHAMFKYWRTVPNFCGSWTISNYLMFGE